jgi:hypothetical protein
MLRASSHKTRALRAKKCHQAGDAKRHLQKFDLNQVAKETASRMRQWE